MIEFRSHVTSCREIKTNYKHIHYQMLTLVLNFVFKCYDISIKRKPSVSMELSNHS